MRPQNSFILLFTIITFQTASFTSAQTLLKNALQPNVCTYDILPSSPRNLVLIPKDKAIEAKWWSPSNKPCEVTYEVAIFGVGGVGKMAAVEVKETRVILTGLNNDLVYDILVTARTRKGRSPPIQASTSPLGIPSKLTSSPSLISGNFGFVPAKVSDWKCIPDVTLNLCPAAASNLCNAMTCAEVAKRGLCTAPFMRQTNWQKREVTQYCSAECGCPAQPSLRTSVEGPRPDACCAIQTGEYFRDENGRSTNGI